MRKGYSAEYKCKKENEEEYGVGNCIKIAIGGSSDYMIAFQGRIIKFIEVKETKKDVYYPSDRERKQFAELVRLGKHHRVPVELWVYFKRGRGKPSIKHVRRIYDNTAKNTEDIGRHIKVHHRKGYAVIKQGKNNINRPLSKQGQFQDS
jgi:hypothetical protein